MSKKDKLKKQHAVQVEQKRLDELDERREKERAKGRQSMAAKKMRRAARRGYVGAFVVLAALVMTVGYIYSGLVYGGFTIYGSLSGQAELIPHSVAYAMLVGDALMLAGIILCFRGKKIAQGLFSLPGSASYLWGAAAVISDLKVRLDQPGTDPGLYGMDERYMRYYLPILAVTVLSAVLFVWGIISLISVKRREKRARDNAPVKSIVDK